MANSTTIIADMKTIIAAGPSTQTIANSVNPSGLSVSGGASGFTNGSGVYASGTYYGGLIDYVGACNVVLLKAQEIAVLLSRIVADTDSGDGQQGNLIKVLNDFQ